METSGVRDPLTSSRDPSDASAPRYTYAGRRTPQNLGRGAPYSTSPSQL